MRRFTPEEDAIVTEMFLDYTPVSEIAAATERSWGVIRQRIFALNLHRSGNVSRALTWAPKELTGDFKKGGLTEEEFLKAAFDIRENELAEATIKMSNIHAGIEDRIKKIQDRTDLTRTEKMLAMRMEGATLEMIGRIYGITRERVRQLTVPRAVVNQTLLQLAHPEEVSLSKLIDVWDLASEEVKKQFLELARGENQ